MTSPQHDALDAHLAQLERMAILLQQEITNTRAVAENIAISDHAHPQAELFTPAEITLRIPDRLRALIDSTARAQDIDPAQVIQQALERHLNVHFASEPTA